MWILADNRIPALAAEKLQQWGELIRFQTSGIVYDAISGHPDIFCFQHPSGRIVAPEIPSYVKLILKENMISFHEGSSKLGLEYPYTAHYNALYTTYGILHNVDVTESSILATHHTQLHCKQAYTRCNAIQVGEIIIISDRGIERFLNSRDIPSYYIDPSEVVLPGFKNGFFAGCCGVLKNQLFICGNLDYVNQGQILRNVLQQQAIQVIELYDGPLVDIGGIFFIQKAVKP
jgi:hypothetical protein